MTENSLDESNTFFDGDACAGIIGDKIEITTGSQTLVISLSEIVGFQATGSSFFP
jgi:hypothetical protein